MGTTTQMLWARSVKVSSYLCSSQGLEVTLCKDCLSRSIKLGLISIQPQISSPWGLVRIFLPSESYLFSEVLFYIKYVSFLNFLVLFYSFPKCYSCLHKHIVPALEVVMCFIFPGLHTFEHTPNQALKRYLEIHLLNWKSETTHSGLVINFLLLGFLFFFFCIKNTVGHSVLLYYFHFLPWTIKVYVSSIWFCLILSSPFIIGRKTLERETCLLYSILLS